MPDRGQERLGVQTFAFGDENPPATMQILGGSDYKKLNMRAALGIVVPGGAAATAACRRCGTGKAP